MQPLELTHSDYLTAALSDRVTTSPLADEARGFYKSAGLVRFNCRPRPLLILLVSLHGNPPHPFWPYLSTEIYAGAAFNTPVQCHNVETWQYINPHKWREQQRNVVHTIGETFKAEQQLAFWYWEAKGERSRFH